ncbi:MAG: DUF1080 domain-containing protein [Opitutae bacterium]|jgi:hypothetical protein|nr:DUF1080 domain-containing protein [Opitutae bacterium]MBT5716870.1 DUF1080 domain-containing protein [Opitutae bacterium]
MKTKLLLFFFLPLFIQAENNHNKWASLFDGKTTKSWTPRAKVEKFEAINGELQLQSKVNVWVLSDMQMTDFEAECEVKIPLDYEKFNSGLGFRLTGKSGKPKGYQFEIDRNKPGAVYGIGLGGWLYPRKEQEVEYKLRSKNLFKLTEWNHVRVICAGSSIKTFLNHKLIAKFKDSQSMSGHFGIQHHGKGGMVAFRKIRAREVK